MVNKKILLLASECDATNILYNCINEKYNIETIVIEEKVNSKDFLKRRINKLGAITVLGQIAFKICIVIPLQFCSKKRISKIFQKNNFCNNPIPTQKIVNVASINDDAVVEIIKNSNPDLIIVNGTRIISPKILKSTSAKFINIHTGITPSYRGVHGGYWALVNNDLENCGVTVHFVDEGIDTGNIIDQAPISITSSDNFCTYPYLQLAEGLTLLQVAIANLFSNNLKPTIKNNGISKLWSHPTLWIYLLNYIKKSVK